MERAGVPIDGTLLSAFREAVRAKIRRDLRDEERSAEALQARVVPLVRQEVEGARAEGVCRRAWLFGSFSWGRPTDHSDVDLLIEGDEEEVGARVASACRREVHAVGFDRAPTALRERVLAEGTPV